MIRELLEITGPEPELEEPTPPAKPAKPAARK
jgi:hypothetical protein